MRDLESDCDVTISVTSRFSSNTDVTEIILVSILPYSRPRNSKIIKVFICNSSRDLESDCDVTISVTQSFFVQYRCYRLNPGVDFTIFEAEELEHDETFYAELTRDLDSDVTIFVTFRISFNANDTGLMLVLIITIFKFEKLKSDETIYVKLMRDLVSECDVTNSVTCRSYSNANDTILMLVSILP